MGRAKASGISTQSLRSDLQSVLWHTDKHQLLVHVQSRQELVQWQRGRRSRTDDQVEFELVPFCKVLVLSRDKVFGTEFQSIGLFGVGSRKDSDFRTESCTEDNTIVTTVEPRDGSARYPYTTQNGTTASNGIKSSLTVLRDQRYRPCYPF